jgi:hypothetical protein
LSIVGGEGEKRKRRPKRYGPGGEEERWARLLRAGAGLGGLLREKRERGQRKKRNGRLEVRV